MPVLRRLWFRRSDTQSPGPSITDPTRTRVKVWMFLRPYLIGAGCMSMWLLASDNDFKASLDAERKRDAAAATRCAKVGKPTSRDKDGLLVCVDQAPAWSMATPLNPGVK